MATSNAPTMVEQRREQMFPTLSSEHFARLSRFGEARSFPAGATITKAGEVFPGLLLITKGQVEVSQTDLNGDKEVIVTHGQGSFMGELAQLSGQPSLVTVVALKAVDAVEIPSRRLRDLFVQEAVLGEQIMRALILRRVGLIATGNAGPIIVGRADDGNVLNLVGFLTRNGHPHRQIDPETDTSGATLLERFHVAPEQLPIVLCPNGVLLRNPSEGDLARCLGLVKPINADKLYDVAIIGAGPAGLAAAVYAGSEGLTPLVLDCRSFGGQAGASSRIENYLGFPTGISGMALMARAYNQAQKFGADMAIPDEAVALHCDFSPHQFRITLANGEEARARSVVIASGAQYRRLDVDNLSDFEGTSVHYWASSAERVLCTEQEVVLVGGGNSAGQAAVYLAEKVKKLWLIVRRDLAETMSKYLIERITGMGNIEVVTQSSIVRLRGEKDALESVCWRNIKTGAETERPIRHLFSFIGAAPNTEWLRPSGITLDEKGFIRTGADVAPARGLLETSRDGVFAIGDVRCGSIKRVASSVGEGAQVVAVLHKYLAQAERSN